MGWKIVKLHRLTEVSLPLRDASPRVTLLLLRRIQHDLLRQRELRGSWESWEALLQNWFCLCPACHPQSLLGQWVDRRGLGVFPLSVIFSSLSIFSLNTIRFLVCFLVFQCVNVFSGNLNTKMSSRISSPLETRNLISSFLDPWTANVTKASRCHTSREIADLRYGFWVHLWPWWRWSGIREEWHIGIFSPCLFSGLGGVYLYYTVWTKNSVIKPMWAS